MGLERFAISNERPLSKFSVRTFKNTRFLMSLLSWTFKNMRFSIGLLMLDVILGSIEPPIGLERFVISNERPLSKFRAQTFKSIKVSDEFAELDLQEHKVFQVCSC